MSMGNVISFENSDVLKSLLGSGTRDLISFSAIWLRTKKTLTCEKPY
jgi:hypothetical protein